MGKTKRDRIRNDIFGEEIWNPNFVNRGTQEGTTMVWPYG
jgi:hypothetical protein